MVIQRTHWFLVALLIALSAGAQLVAQEAGDVVVIRGSMDDDVYVAGRSVDVAAEVQGDVTAAGQSVSIDQRVTGDVLAAGETVTILARVQDDVRAAGRNVTIAGPVAGHVVAAGETVSIAPSATVGGWAWLAGAEVKVAGTVGGELKAAGQTVIISGQIGGDAELMAKTIRILGRARIKGDLIYRSDREPQISEGAVISGDIIAKPVLHREPEGRAGGLVALGALALAAGVYYLLFPVFSVAGAAGLWRTPFTALGVGLAFLFTTPFVVLLLFATLIGGLVALPLLAYYLVSLLGGLLTGVITVGDAGLRLIGKADPGARGLRVLSIVLALVALVLIQIIPVVGGLALLLLFLLGLGALQLQAWRRYSE
jgi:cytoskeletal protein CcmA (bactofilin family)